MLSDFASSYRIWRKSYNLLSSYGKKTTFYNMASIVDFEFKSFEFWSQDFRYCPNLQYRGYKFNDRIQLSNCRPISNLTLISKNNRTCCQCRQIDHISILTSLSNASIRRRRQPVLTTTTPS